MELQGRNLSLRKRGEDVRLLQEELQRLSFAIEDTPGLFGATTRQAVRDLQRQNDLEPTGVVDEIRKFLMLRRLHNTKNSDKQKLMSGQLARDRSAVVFARDARLFWLTRRTNHETNNPKP